VTPGPGIGCAGVSEENVELLRRAYERINGVGRVEPDEIDMAALVPEIWSRLDPEVELHERPELVDRRVYRGIEESKSFWRKTWEIFAEVHWVPEEFIVRGDAVIVVARVVATGRGSETPVEMDESDVWWFREGRIVRIAGFGTKAEALAAVDASRPT
jgi:ketosteroid isomerase-like protein